VLIYSTAVDLVVAARAAQKRCYKVEDVNSIRMLGQRLLSRAGAQCSTAADGQLAVVAVRESLDDSRPFDVVLMDFHMPILDGVQAMQ
jgi:two-component system sensor histidine kinase/response regulator